MPTLPIALKGSQFAVSSSSTAAGLSIANLANGDVAVAWQDGSNAAVQLLNGNGGAASGEITVATAAAGHTLTNENVVGLANGNFVVTWNDTVTSGGNTFVTVDGQMYGSNLAPIGGQFTIISQFQQSFGFTGADLFATPDGGFTYAESRNQFEVVQAYHADGTPNGGQIQFGSQFPYLFGATALTNGNYATLIGNLDSFRVDTPNGSQVVGDTFIAGSNAQRGDIASLPNGRFVVTYLGFANGGGLDVAAQIYNSDGTTFGTEIAVNNGVSNTGSTPYPDPHVSAMPDGRFIVSWYDTSGDAGNNLTEVRVFNPNGTAASGVFAIPGSTEGNVFPYDNDVTALSDTSFAVDWNTGSGISGQVLSIPPPEDNHDFRGIGQGDILIQGASTAQIIYAKISGGAFQGWNSVVTTPGWGVVGSGKISGGNDADIVIENGSGQIQYANLVNGQFNNWVSVGQAPGFAVVGVGDVNADSYDDVIIQNQSSGEIAWGNMNGGTLQGWTSIGSVPGWSVGAVADVNGAGSADILIQNQSTGQIAYANMAGGTFHGWVSIASTPGWKLVGAGDVTGLGENDLVIENPNTGQIMYGNMPNGTLQGWHNVGTVPGWNVTGVEYVVGNGNADIVIQNPSTGQIAYADMTGGVFQQWISVATAPGFVAHSGPGVMGASVGANPLEQAAPAGALAAPNVAANTEFPPFPGY